VSGSPGERSGAPGPSTRAVGAGLPAPVQGEPFLPGPVLAAPYHLAGARDASSYGYARDSNPTLERLEAAIGELEGGHAVVYASGMAAVSAALEDVLLSGGGVLVAPSDGYPGVRAVAREVWAPRGVELRFVATDTCAILEALDGATAVWLETPANPGLDVCDIAAVGAAALAAGAVVLVDNTLATPLLQQPLALGADVSVVSATKALAGHSDVLLGAVTVREAEAAARLRRARSRAGAVPGPFEAWLVHRSLATLALRLERQQANALAVAEFLRSRPEVSGVRYPGLPDDPAFAVAARQMSGFGPVVGFDVCGGEEAAQAFLAQLRLVAEATSFGGVHTTAERRARWGTDAVGTGFIRFSCGIEDAADLVADVERALGGG
jgi:cystathionine gamma-lyase